MRIRKMRLKSWYLTLSSVEGTMEDNQHGIIATLLVVNTNRYTIQMQPLSALYKLEIQISSIYLFEFRIELLEEFQEALQRCKSTLWILTILKIVLASVSIIEKDMILNIVRYLLQSDIGISKADQIFIIFLGENR